MRSATDTIANRRLYLCVGTSRAGVLAAAIAGGVDVIQLREKNGDERTLLAAAADFRMIANRAGVPFILNDRPDLVAQVGADGVHVGQDDTPVGEARAQMPEKAIVGLSTHSPAQLDAALAAEGAARPDYVSVGPVWETPTKPGRAATGLEYVRYAASHADLPWFAIGGIDAENVEAVLDAGATRIVVVRAIADAPDPAAAAAALSAAMTRSG